MNREIDRRIKEARLTPTEQKIAEYISLNHSNIFSLSALRLGELIGTSDTSVIRTARKLGFARIMVPSRNRLEETFEGIEIIKVASVSQAIYKVKNRQ